LTAEVSAVETICQDSQQTARVEAAYLRHHSAAGGCAVDALL